MRGNSAVNYSLFPVLAGKTRECLASATSLWKYFGSLAFAAIRVYALQRSFVLCSLTFLLFMVPAGVNFVKSFRDISGDVPWNTDLVTGRILF